MKKLLLSITSICLYMSLLAQYPLVNISDIQTVDGADLVAGIDASSMIGDTVTVRGIVTFDPCDYALSSSGSRVGTFIQDENSTDAFTGIHVLAEGDPFADIFAQDQNIQFADNMQVGNIVEIVARVSTFGGSGPTSNTQLSMIDEPVSIMGFATLPDPVLSEIPVFMASDGAGGQITQVATGEPYEGMLVRFENVAVVDVAAGSDGRFFWSVQDGNGNRIQIRDMSGHLRNGTNDDFCSGGDEASNTPTTFDPLPLQGALVTFIQGHIVDYNGIYYISPRDETDIGPTLAAPPVVQEDIMRSPVVPTSSQNVTISANITDIDGTVTSAALFYSVGLGNTTFSSVPMVNSMADEWVASIPAQADQEYVNYYINAVDNESNSTDYPDNMASGSLYQVLDAGIDHISVIQQTPFNNGGSIYAGYALDVMNITGIITAGTQDFDLGLLTIQNGNDPYSGIQVLPSPGDGLTDLKRGDEVEITSATVNENFGVTRLESVTYTLLSEGNTVPDPVLGLTTSEVAVNSASIAEEHESMLVGFVNIEVVDTNPDFPSNFGEWSFQELGDTDALRVDDWSNDFPFDFNSDSLLIGQEIAEMYGILTFSFGNWKLLPRNLSDIDGYSTEYPKRIDFFDFPSENLFGSVNESNNTVSFGSVSGGLDITNLTPEIVFEGESISPASGVAQDFTSPVTYTVTACIDGSTQDYVVSIDVVNVEEFTADELNIYPQPANDILSIDFKDEAFISKGYSLINTSGQTLMGGTIDAAYLELNVSSLHAGIYFLRIEKEAGTFGYAKLIVE